jgi:hypothetical protein
MAFYPTTAKITSKIKHQSIRFPVKTPCTMSCHHHTRVFDSTMWSPSENVLAAVSVHLTPLSLALSPSQVVMMAPSFTMLSILIATRGGLGGCTIPPSDCIHVAATTLICNTKQQEAVSWNGARQG